MRALASPASCKGALSAVEAALALAAGLSAGGLDTDALPVADGGEGTAEVFAASVGGEWRQVPASDPLGRVVAAGFLVLEDGTAVVEAAEAVGLARLAEEERDPMRASSRGLGQLLLAAAAEAGGPILVGLGDSATVDGGAGLLEVVGDTLAGRELRALCDVRNPLLGEQIVMNYRVTRIDKRQRAMLDFAVKVTSESHLVGDADFAALREHGFSDDDAWDIAGIAALFGLSNRIANVSSMRPNDEFYLMGRVPRAKI